MNMMNRIGYISFAACCLLVSCRSGSQKDNSGEPAVRIEPVKTITLSSQTIRRTVEYTSTLLAWEELHLAPTSPGRIEKINVEIGDRVSRGDILVQMDLTQLHQAEVQLGTLETDFRRLDTLKKVGSIAGQQYDQLKAQLDIARNNVAFLAENARLEAPFSGVVSGRYFEQGEMYSGAPNPLAGKAAIVSIVQIDRLKAIVPVSEKYFPVVRTGQKTGITLDIYPDKVFAGQIFRIHPTIDPASRSFNVEISISNNEGILRPGMFCRISLEMDEIQSVLLPSIAVLKLQGSNERYLFVEENGIARRVTVKVGKRYDDQVEVLSDILKPGDQIVVSGQARLLDGMQVSVEK